MTIHVAALYRFVRLEDFAALREPLMARMIDCGVRGTILLAREGLNGTIAGRRDDVEALLDHLRRDTRLADLDCKWSTADTIPFGRSRVRLKREIVTMGVEGIDPNHVVGTYVDADRWNELVDDPGVLVIDTRNEYETAIGRFAGAVDPETDSFREFPRFVDEHLDPDKHRSVAMYCTGGIRCEKATALLKRRGFKNVYHLRGGILKYLESVPRERSRFQGDCFVFDERVAVDHDLNPTDHVVCFGCGWPVTCRQQADPRYRAGVHCPTCVDRLTDDQKRRFETRHQQMIASGKGSPEGSP